MRVTNDEARLLIYDIDIRAEKRILSVNESRIHEVCTDLLEAREFIDKQEEIIKEMRSCIADIKYAPWIEVSERIAHDMNAILEKSKDYA